MFQLSKENVANSDIHYFALRPKMGCGHACWWVACHNIMPTLPGEMKCIDKASMAQWCNCSSLERNNRDFWPPDHMYFIITNRGWKKNASSSSSWLSSISTSIFTPSQPVHSVGKPVCHILWPYSPGYAKALPSGYTWKLFYTQATQGEAFWVFGAARRRSHPVV